jgi:catechol 2,3-dioxygenase-like lactoylglutathione lyase family enzyme
MVFMHLGNFSVSLAVKDLASSKAFYEKLGFSQIHGDEKQGWVILHNGTTNIGLFQGMFDKNILTFNPGWDHNGKEIESFTDIRDLQTQLEDAGVEFATKAEVGAGPASFTVIDPDGNTVLVDQHRDKL